jgi:hypothetical protein
VADGTRVEKCEDQAAIRAPKSCRAVPHRRWTEDEVRRFRQLYAQGLTFAEMGEELGRPRNSCISKAHQLKLTGRDKVDQGRKGYERMVRRLRAEWLAEIEAANG